MASSKDTFESKTFAANSFASGTFRGTGVDVSPDSEIIALLVNFEHTQSKLIDFNYEVDLW